MSRILDSTKRVELNIYYIFWANAWLNILSVVLKLLIEYVFTFLLQPNLFKLSWNARASIWHFAKSKVNQIPNWAPSLMTCIVALLPVAMLSSSASLNRFTRYLSQRPWFYSLLLPYQTLHQTLPICVLIFILVLTHLVESHLCFKSILQVDGQIVQDNLTFTSYGKWLVSSSKQRFTSSFEYSAWVYAIPFEVLSMSH